MIPISGFLLEELAIFCPNNKKKYIYIDKRLKESLEFLHRMFESYNNKEYNQWHKN